VRVAIDAHALGSGAGGNETYIRLLLAALRDHAPDVTPVALTPHGQTIEGIETRNVPFANTPLRPFFSVPFSARRCGADILHAQYFAPKTSLPTVVSIHDVAWRACPDTLPNALRARLEATIPTTIRRARKVLVLTQAVKNELIHHYDMEPDRIDVVSPYPDPIFGRQVNQNQIDNVLKQHKLPESFVFYYGAMQPRKNLARLARAVARLDNISLVVAGPRLWRVDEVVRDIQAAGLGDRLRFLNYVERETLPVLLKAAAAFAYVPLYEGFGLPLLEALAAGTPILTSDIPVLREVAGETALFADPLDEDALHHALRDLLTDPARRQAIQDAGPARAALYTPKAMAHAAAMSYRSA